MKLRNKSDRISKRSEQKGREDSPREAPVDPDDPGDDADVPTTSGSVEDVGKRPKKLSNTSKRERKRSKRKSRKYSPGRPGGEPDEPGAETAVPGDIHNLHKRPRKVSNERVDERTHQVEIEPLEAIEASRSRQESSRAIRTAQTLSTTPNTMGCVPGATGMRAASYRTRRVEIEGREAIRASRSRRESSRAIGGAGLMSKASHTIGNEGRWMAQRAAHAATRNESKRIRSL